MWVSTAASGMKRSRYGNIEDMVLNAALVTAPSGDIHRRLIATARSSAGILFLISAASLYAWVAAWENLPAMAAARIWPEPVLASDIDEVAVEVAQANVDANNLSGRVTCVEAAGFDHPQLAEAAPFDLVFANILKGPLVALAPDMAGALQPAGYAILSGLLNEQADEVIEIYARSGINLVRRESIGDWTTLTLQTNA